MNRITGFLLASALFFATDSSFGQTDEGEKLRMAALEALMSAPPNRALPIVKKLLSADETDEIKSRALFVLSQIEGEEAQAILLDMARNETADLRLEAIRMIGIGGSPGALEGLSDIYSSGDGDTKGAVLEAYLIADDDQAVYQIAADTNDPKEFENAVETLGAMGAMNQLRALRERGDMTGILIEAFAVAGDVESLQSLARDSDSLENQIQAIKAMGIAGGSDVDESLVSIYRESDSADIKKAALEGMMISDNDDGVLLLFQESEDNDEKRILLQMLVAMDSDAVWDLVEDTLGESR